MEVGGANVREVLARVFAVQGRLGTYVLDDQGALRKHMTILVDGRRISGSTTGNMWVSEDQEDSWATVSTSLPPIHAVGFVR